MNIFSKKFIFILLFLLGLSLFFIANAETARAEVTCCTCEGERELDPCIGGGRMGSPQVCNEHITGFACAQGTRSCSYTCQEGTPTSKPRQGTWTPVEGENKWAQGDVVTCCSCGNAEICSAVNHSCDTICEDLGGYPTSHFLRARSEVVEGRSSISGEVSGELGEKTAEETTSAKKAPPVEIEEPNISIPIPGFIGFSEIKTEGGEIDIPWIGEYIVAIFNWLLAIVGGVATTMIMIGGFLYLTAAGNQSRIGKGKDMVTNAVIGLFLAFGSYLILFTINPDLVTFKNIRLGVTDRSEIEFDNNPPEDQEGNVVIGNMASTGNFGGSAATNWAELRNLAGCTRTAYESKEEAIQAFTRAAGAFLASTRYIDYVSGGSPSATTCGRCHQCDSATLARVQAKTNICLDCATFTRALFTCIGFRNVTVALPPLYAEANRPYYHRFQTEAHPDPEKNTVLLEKYESFIGTGGRGARGTSGMVRSQRADFASFTEFARRIQNGDVVLQPGDMIVNAAFQREGGSFEPKTGHFVTTLDGVSTIEVTRGTNGSLWRSTGGGTFNANANGGAVKRGSLNTRITQKTTIENRLNGVFPVILLRLIH